ncbi:MAG TPA: ABC transporter permease [Actinocrinis sp.]|nr:ABC transporter permease [Actinocrinis sp.]HZU55628.1 ABC transporter permease [Actinocrinis sp.]
MRSLPMATFLLRRLLGAIVTLLVLSVIVYGLFYLLPTDPARMICGPRCSPQDVAAVSRAYGLDQPIYVQYWHFLAAIVAGRDYSTGPSTVHCGAPCFGYSFETGQSVDSLLLSALPVTASLTLGGAVLWTTFGVGAGIASALRRGRLADKTLTGLVLASTALPPFVLALFLILLFCAYLQWLPFPNYVSIGDDPVQWAQSLILPWATLALLQAANYARLTRTSVLETLNEDHIRTARAYGLSERRIVARHALRGALTPLVSLLAVDVGPVLGGAVFTESVFGLPGLGKLLVGSVATVDLPVVGAVALLAGAFVILANVAADLLYVAIDPRASIR